VPVVPVSRIPFTVNQLRGKQTMIYPMGPKTETELFAWLFGLLYTAYAKLAENEEADRKREHQRIRYAFADKTVKRTKEQDADNE
jgi:hypothetical protein